GWVERISRQVCNSDTRVVGFNSTFEQTSCAASFIKCIKGLKPQLPLIIGGANCEGQMAKGISLLVPEVDHIFSGESEVTFIDYLQSVVSNTNRALTKVVEGAPCRDLDSLPVPDFSDYYDQMRRCQAEGWIPTSKHIWLPYEGSRGCWWGQKHHCTFCGINGQGMAFREKTADRVYSDLKYLLERHPTDKVMMVDNIMPSSYF